MKFVQRLGIFRPIREAETLFFNFGFFYFSSIRSVYLLDGIPVVFYQFAF
jgi:hypothetical protein